MGHLCKRGRLDLIKWIYEQGEEKAVHANGKTLYHAFCHQKWNIVNWLLKRPIPSLGGDEMAENKRSEMVLYLLLIMEKIKWGKVRLPTGGTNVEERLFDSNDIVNRIIAWMNKCFNTKDTGKKINMRLDSRRGRNTKRKSRGDGVGTERQRELNRKRVKTVHQENEWSGEERGTVGTGKLFNKMGTGEAGFDRLFIERLGRYMVQKHREGEERIYVPAPGSKCREAMLIYDGQLVKMLEEQEGTTLDSPFVHLAVERILTVLWRWVAFRELQYTHEGEGGWQIRGFNPGLMKFQ